jgi:hypothetical protein
MKQPGIKALRWLSFLLLLWMAAEVVRVYYMKADLDRFLKVAQFLLGPWFAVFAVAAGGSHFKRLTEAWKIKQEK